jgi:hypothetical protein
MYANMGNSTPVASKLENNAIQIETERHETWCVLTILYVCLEVARASEDEAEQLALRAQISMYTSSWIL